MTEHDQLTWKICPAHNGTTYCIFPKHSERRQHSWQVRHTPTEATDE